MTSSMSSRVGRGPGESFVSVRIRKCGKKGADLKNRNKIVFISWSPDEGTLVFVCQFPPSLWHQILDDTDSILL